METGSLEEKGVTTVSEYKKIQNILKGIRYFIPETNLYSSFFDFDLKILRSLRLFNVNFNNKNYSIGISYFISF